MQGGTHVTLQPLHPGLIRETVLWGNPVVEVLPRLVCCGFQELNSGPCACQAHTLLTGPFAQPLKPSGHKQ